MEKCFGEYSHDLECVDLAYKLENMQTELMYSLAINEVQRTESINQFLLEIKFFRDKLASCSCNLLIIGYDMIADYQEFKKNPYLN